MRRGAIVGVVAGAVALVAAAGVTWWLLSRPPSAEDAARAYLDALEAGDGEAVSAMMPSDDETAATARDALADATAYIEDPRIDEVRQDDDGVARVTAAVQLDGEERTLSFGLREEGGRWALIPETLAELTVEAAIAQRTPLAAVRIGEALVPTATPVPLHPAVYEVVAAPAGIVEGSAVVAVSTDRPAEAEVEASLSPDATARAQEQLDTYVAACTEPAAAVPDHCGIVVPWAADLATIDAVAFRVEETPAVALAEDASGFDATAGVLVATATGTTHDGAAGTFTYRTDEWALRGAIRFDGEEMVLAVR